MAKPKERCIQCNMKLEDPKHKTHWLSGECLMVYDERFPSTYDKPRKAPK